jgi:hypothetical protein
VTSPTCVVAKRSKLGGLGGARQHVPGDIEGVRRADGHGGGGGQALHRCDTHVDANEENMFMMVPTELRSGQSMLSWAHGHL